MQIILPAAENVIKILGTPKASAEECRPMHYAVRQEIDDIVLLFRTLTRELLLLADELHERFADQKILCRKEGIEWKSL